ncbi:ankyrin repeat-containing domain protein [Lasiosphaeria miniovina]|uniref:Ankyrin repeat-containing domain protein n=1 Tax=Lasiosphaeria miniovina TaxID=1954250 RepID=A0AA40BFE4_9PEZI|nr:ankyrin repeat-containing domain protein [Lasiosphaeria miniovina]KAK0733230.1 ankyrin repeat-containing domain protein [Lasiosphaeria miniovina]
MPKLDWDAHRADIERLYIAEGKCLTEVMDIMKRDREFLASKPSYERKMRAWGLQKNTMGKQTWDVVAYKVEKRKKLGKESSVYEKGVRLAAEKLQREIPRHTALTLGKKFTIDTDLPSPKTPEGIVVCSPSPLQQHLSWNNESPWSRFIGLMWSSGFQGLSLEAKPPQASDLAPLSQQLSGSSMHSLMRSSTMIQVPSYPMTFPTPQQIMPDAIQLRPLPEVPRTFLTQFFLLSNNFTVMERDGVSARDVRLHDAHVVGMIERLRSAGFEQINSLLSTESHTTEAIKEHCFASILRSGRLDLLRIILETGVDLDMVIHSGNDDTLLTPLQFAVGITDRRKSLGTTRLLLEYGAKPLRAQPCPGEQCLLSMATQKGHLEVVGVLVNAGAYPCQHATISAIENGFDALLQQLLDAGADVNFRLLGETQLDYGTAVYNATPIGVAAKMGNVRIARLLMERGAEVNAKQSLDCAMFFSGTNRICRHQRHTLNTTALGLAIGHGKFEVAQFLTHEAGAAINSPIPAARETRSRELEIDICPLAIACHAGKSESIIMLLDADADLASAEANSLALPCAPATLLGRLTLNRLQSHCDHDESTVNVYKKLIDKGARLDHALLGATMTGNSGLISLLLHRGAPVNCFVTRKKRDGMYRVRCTKMRTTALGAAIELGSVEIVRMLYDAGARELGDLERIPGDEMATFLEGTGMMSEVISKRLPSVLDHAIEHGDQKLVKNILSRDVDLSEDPTNWIGHSYLDTAIRKGADLELVETLIEHGAPLTKEVFLTATLEGSQDIRKALFRASSAIEGRVGHTPVVAGPSIASKDGREWRLKIKEAAILAAEHAKIRPLNNLLVELNWEPRSAGLALTVAIARMRNGELYLVQHLLDAGASFDEPFGGHISALAAAVAVKEVPLVNTLLSSGADVNKSAIAAGKTALQAAADVGHLELVDLLLKRGADVNGPPAPSRGATALQFAATRGYLSIATRLLDAGADVNAPKAERGGRTALMGAAEHGRIDMLHLLLDRGANVHGSDRTRFVEAVFLAEQRGRRATAGFLKSHGGWTESDDELKASLRYRSGYIWASNPDASKTRLTAEDPPSSRPERLDSQTESRGVAMGVQQSLDVEIPGDGQKTRGTAEPGAEFV